MRRIMSTCVNLNNCQVFAAPTYSLMHIGTMYINKSSKSTQVVHFFPKQPKGNTMSYKQKS